MEPTRRKGPLKRAEVGKPQPRLVLPRRLLGAFLLAMLAAGCSEQAARPVSPLAIEADYQLLYNDTLVGNALFTLAIDTHKFEARYLDSMIGPLPEASATYRERSPIHSADRITSPVIFFQGLEDKVVPPAQTETMVAALRANGVAVACLTFEGESHGFRRAETIRRVLEAELAFYGRVLGFEPAGAPEPPEIENL